MVRSRTNKLVDLRWKTTVGEGLPLVEDTIFDGRQPSVEDDLRKMSTFGGRRPPLGSHNTTEPNRYQASQPELEFAIVRTGQGWSGLVINGQILPGLIRNDQE